MVVTEAGGRVSDIHGRALDFSRGRTLKSNKGVVATNGRLHDRVVAAIGQVVGTA
jgi:3'(2'), 5'-bisphosphate nucleotidase